MDSNNIIVKCLGKTLKTEVKFIANVEMRCLNLANKDIENLQNESGVGMKKKIICLCTEKIFILNETMEKRFDTIAYELLSYMELDKKLKDVFAIYIKPNTIMKNNSIVKINIKSEFRGALIKSFMCYYSVYYMHRFCVVKSFQLVKEKSLDKKEESEAKVFSKLKQRSLKSYNFFLNGLIQKEYNNVYFKIKYDLGIQTGKQEEFFSNECELNIEISDSIFMGKFESNRDDRDVSFYAYNTFNIYMLNTLKANLYWITKSKIFNKTYNLNEDACQWEGWTIEARTSDPSYKNYIFVFLRRKFLPPLFDSYQSFNFILSESCSKESFKINPAAHKLIELIANSIQFSNSSSSTRDSQLFLEAKIDSLLVDEETLYFYQFSQKIVGKDIYKFGFDFLYTLLCYFEISMKEKIEPFKYALQSKFKEYELDKIEKWTFERKNYNFLEKINEFINSSILNQRDNGDAIADGEFNIKDNYKFGDTIREDNLEKNINESDTGNGNSNKKAKPIDEEKILKIKRNWRMKVMRFISYCLSGSLTDFMMTFEKFLTDIFYKNQSTNNDLQDLIFQTINITELDNYDSITNKDKLSSLTENSKLTFNEESMAVTIKTGFLAKLLSDNVSAFPKFLNIILTKYSSNKILNSVLEFLKLSSDMSGDDSGMMSDDRKAFIHIINPLITIFADKRKSPSTLSLCCKCLCLLVCRKSDDVFRKKILIEGNIISVIATYLDMYHFDEKLVLCCLDLFVLTMNEPELQILDYLYGYPCRLFEKLQKFFDYTGVPGTYYSQRIIIKVLTIFLNLTNKIEAEVKPKINSQYVSFYDLLLRLINDSQKHKVIDPKEEESYILEFKTYWLLCILTFKNQVAKEHFKSVGIKTFIDEKSKKFSKIIDTLLLAKNMGVSESKLTAISKNIAKFFEFVYYLIINDKEDVLEYRKELVYFNILKVKISENKSSLLLQDKESSVFDLVDKLFHLSNQM